jgi:Fanconi anemia group J protein
MDSFASELGVPFEIQMEASHVVDMDKQVWAATLSLGPGNVPLNASFKNADGYAFQDALGTVLEEICKVVPDGALIFFPSFKLLDKLCARWQATGQWTRFLEEKQLFVEPKGSSDQFDQVLNNYYQVINSSSKPIKKNIKGRNQKHTIKFGESKEHQAQKEHGAAFLAVCRGKVSEGIDFSDKNARVVVSSF